MSAVRTQVCRVVEDPNPNNEDKLDPLKALRNELEDLGLKVSRLTEGLAQSLRAQVELIEVIRAQSDREQQRYVSVSTAAKRLGKSQKTIRRWLKTKRLLGFKVGKTDQAEWLVDVRSIELERR